MRKAVLITILVNMFAFLPAGFFVSYQHEKQLFNAQRLLAVDELTQHANTLSGSIQKRFALLEGLYAFALANPHQEQLNAKFETFASALQTGIAGIRNFALAPSGVNDYVYPLQGNEKVIGHNLLDDPRPNVRIDVQRAIKTQQITLSGPYPLRQGGLGLVARKAIFRGDKFWGLATMVVDMPPVLTEAGLDLPSGKSNISLRKGGGKCFYGAEQAFAGNSILLRIDLPDGFWEIATAANKELLPPLKKQQNTFNAFTSIAAGLLSILIYTIANRQAYLTEKVKEQTLDLEGKLVEQRIAERALLESENQLRTLIEQSPTGLALCKMDGSLVTVNPTFAKIIGYGVAETLQLTYWDVTPDKYAPQESRQLEQLKTSGRYGPYEKEYRHKDGHLVPVRLNGMIVVRDGENFIWSSVEDITAQKEAEAEKNELADQLRQSQKMEAIGTLAGGVAHDFNNILSAVLGYTELTLRNPNCDAKSKKNLEHVLAAAGRARELVKQILMFSRKGKEKREPVKIHLVVEEAVELLRKTIPSTIPINLDIAENTGSVLADATQIHQVVMNLCTNAYHSMQEQSGKIDIRLQPVAVDNVTAAKYPNLRQGRYCLLTVSDTGTGMPPEIMSRIFDPFFTTKGHGEGTGMGLAVVHGIVQNHDGAIGVASEVGKGTTFTVFFPLLAGVANSKTPLTDTSVIKRGTEHVLWVDDESMLAELGKESLESLGYKVTATTSATEALNFFQADPNSYDLIVTDQTMAEMTGDVLAKKAMLVRADIPIVICTGHSATLNAEKALAIGVKALLMKPLNINSLGEEIRKILDQSA